MNGMNPGLVRGTQQVLFQEVIYRMLQNNYILRLALLYAVYLLSQKSAVFASVGRRLCPSEYCVAAVKPRGCCGGSTRMAPTAIHHQLSRTYTNGRNLLKAELLCCCR